MIPFLLLIFSGSIIFSQFIGVKCTVQCSIHLIGPSGVFQSPNYPEPYKNNTNCVWHIRPNKPGAANMLFRIEVLDIEPDDSEECHFQQVPCCKHNWLTVSGWQPICGNHLPTEPLKVTGPVATVEMHVSKVRKGGRGFRIRYSTVHECSIPGMVPCGPNADSGCYHNATQRCDGIEHCFNKQDENDCLQMCSNSCASGIGCFSTHQKCDGYPNCEDFSDEINCGFCDTQEALCSTDSHHCFHPPTERCNSVFDCPWGEDERGCVPSCEGKIACSSGEGCYSPAQRCDTLSDCMDGSDEARCPPELCSVLPDKRLCHNGRCLPDSVWCDGQDDCGDNSDEATCLKNSMIALAIIGCLVCGLLLVIAVGCAFRVYGHQFASPSGYQHLQWPPRIASRLRNGMSSWVSLPTILDDGFFHREPPPAYSVAVGETETNLTPPGPRRPRRYRPYTVPVPPPQVGLAKPPDSPCEASSSQSSPSRGSVTSSSYVSGTDDTLLLSS